jgi:RNA polymerase sigma factor (sigma-70 family)
MLPSDMISGAVLRTQPDERLATLAARGSERAFETLVQRYRRPLLAYCRRLLLSESRSEDVVQQALLSAWTALQKGVEVREVKAWLYRITHNQAISALRSPGYDLAELHESTHEVDASEADPERRSLVRETLAAVAALPELQREAILRTAIDGRSYEEVATALGVSDHAIRGLVYRARLSVRSAVAVAAPVPLVVWVVGQARRCGGLAQWLTESVAGGGSATGAAVVLKSAAVLASSAAVVGGTVTVALANHEKGASAQVRLNAGRRAQPTNRIDASVTRHVSRATPIAAHGTPEHVGARTGTPTTPVALVSFSSHAGKVGHRIPLAGSFGSRSPNATQPSPSGVGAASTGGPSPAVRFGPMSGGVVETTRQRTGDSSPSSQAPTEPNAGGAAGFLSASTRGEIADARGRRRDGGPATPAEAPVGNGGQRVAAERAVCASLRCGGVGSW